MSLVPWLGGGGPGTFDPFSLDVWDPFGFGRGLWDTSRTRSNQDETLAIALANVDWKETENAHIFRADLPGVRKEDVKVEIEDGNVLHISGDRVKEEEVKGDTWHRIERRRGSFSRRFRLPDNVKVDEIKCSLENGVLTVCVPKKETPQSSRNVKSIDIQ